MTDTEKQAVVSAGVDYIAIIKAAKEHGVMHLKIGSFEITMQVVPPKYSFSSLSQPPVEPHYKPLQIEDLAATPKGTATTTAEFASPAAAKTSALEKLQTTRKQFDDFRNMKPPSSNGNGASDE